MHQLAYLTPKRAVAWKCLSLQAQEGRSATRFTPVAYASLSPRFFPDSDDRSPGVLWVISSPRYKRSGAAEQVFPPTLTAKLVVERLVTGDEVANWATQDRDRELSVPSGKREFEAWRRAESVSGGWQRAAFRIARDFAMIAWRNQSRPTRRSQPAAWKKVRTAIAAREGSDFLAHVDATKCLIKALDLPRGFKSVGTYMRSPRRLRDERLAVELESLARRGRDHTIFMNYRWNGQADDVALVARHLLDMKCGVWLDGLAMPHFSSHPVWRLRGRVRRKDPPQIDLEKLLHNGIEASALFVCLAGEDYTDRPAYDPETENWAMREYHHVADGPNAAGAPVIRIVDLGGAPDCIKRGHGRVLKYDGDPGRLAEKIAAIARRC